MGPTLLEPKKVPTQQMKSMVMTKYYHLRSRLSYVRNVQWYRFLQISSGLSVRTISNLYIDYSLKKYCIATIITDLNHHVRLSDSPEHSPILTLPPMASEHNTVLKYLVRCLNSIRKYCLKFYHFVTVLVLNIIFWFLLHSNVKNQTSPYHPLTF